MNDVGHLRKIQIKDIILREDVFKRAVNEDAVQDLVRGFAAVGMITPIRVRPTQRYFSGVLQDAWELIAGRHRVEAAKASGWTEIEANVKPLDDDRAELAMLTENIERANLSDAELSYAMARSKELYEKVNQDTTHGGDRKSSRNNCDLIDADKQPTPRFSEVMSKATGKSERAVQMIARPGKALGRDVLRVAGTSLDSRTELDALAALAKQDREAAVTLMDQAAAGEKVSATAAMASIKAFRREPEPPAPVPSAALGESMQPPSSPLPGASFGVAQVGVHIVDDYVKRTRSAVQLLAELDAIGDYSIRALADAIRTALRQRNEPI